MKNIADAYPKTVQEIIKDGWFESETKDETSALELINSILNAEELVKTTTWDLIKEGSFQTSELFCFNRIQLIFLIMKLIILPEGERKRLINRLELTVRKTDDL